MNELISSAQIEQMLEKHPDIQQAVAKIHHSNNQQQYTCIYIKANINKKPTIREIRSFLHYKLPEYIIPSRIMLVDDFTIMADGAVDTGSLPDLEFCRCDTDVEYVPPRSNLENILCRIWSSVLNVNTVGVYDNFFSLGGHPYLAFQLVSKVRTILRANIPVSAILTSIPTIEQSALAIEMFQFAQFSYTALEELVELELKNSNTELLLTEEK
ncbi:MAG: phosphopantetheine-binding protein [Clostridia bacterium]|nr:phosphopantetheine-binding protein [Clostridia bacterium]